MTVSTETHSVPWSRSPAFSSPIRLEAGRGGKGLSLSRFERGRGQPDRVLGWREETPLRLAFRARVVVALVLAGVLCRTLTLRPDVKATFTTTQTHPSISESHHHYRQHAPKTPRPSLFSPGTRLSMAIKARRILRAQLHRSSAACKFIFRLCE